MKIYKYNVKKKKSVWIDADSAVRKIQKGKRVLIGSGCAEPQHLVKALVKNATHFRDNEVVHILTVGIAPYASPEFQDHFRLNTFFIGHNIRDSIMTGHSDYLPIFLSEIPRLFTSKMMPLHCALIQVSSPDKNGFVSLGVSVDILPAAIASAEFVIAQVNKNMPFTMGAAKIPLSCIDYLVAMDEPIMEFPQGTPDAVSMQIGKHLSRYIFDGDTLQLGIGSIPDAVLKYMTDKNDLGVHSEMVSDGIVELYKKKNITNKKKGFNNGKSIVSFILGTKKLYDTVNNNPDFQFYPTEYTNDPFIISKNKNMVSINSAIQVDLTGQVCSDSIGTKFYSGFGGQVDFVRGAKRSEGGRSFIALPSTAKGGEISRIVPELAAGAGVVTSRADVQHVATEYGVAYLHGKNIRERALALIEIAHPKFREQLLESIKKRYSLYINARTILDDDNPVKEIIPHSKTFKGKTVYFRPLRPHDEKAIQDFFYSHKPETIYYRYLNHVDALSLKEAQARVAVDYGRDFAMAGYDSWAPYAKMVCLGRYARSNEDSAEAGFVVKEDYQAFGIGTFMCECLIKAAEAHNLKYLNAHVSRANIGMLKIFKRNDFKKKEYKMNNVAFLQRDINPSKK